MAQLPFQTQGIDWGRVLQAGISGYTQTKGLQVQQSREERTQEQYEDERFRRERALTASDIQGKPQETQLDVLQRRIQTIQKRGGDPSNTQGMYDLIASGDQAKINEAQGYIQNAITQGEREGFLRPQSRAGGATLTATQKDLIASGLIPGTPEYQKAMQEQLAGGDAQPTGLEKNLILAGYQKGTPEFQAEVRKQIAKIPKGETATSLEKNLALGGYEKGTPEYRKMVRDYLTRSGDKIQIDLGTKTEAGELGKSRVRRFEKIQEGAETAQDTINSLDVLDNIDVSTGRAEPMKQTIAAWGQSMGINTDKLANVAAGEAFTAEAGRVVLNAMAAQKGPQTESDMRQIRTTVAGLGKTPEANKFINNSARAMSIRKMEQRDFYEQFLAENDTLKGASKAWNDYKRNTPMVSNKLKTEKGLPLFFYQFENEVMTLNPGASRQQVLEEWKKQHRGK